jgi:hypothetical protein
VRRPFSLRRSMPIRLASHKTEQREDRTRTAPVQDQKFTGK